MSSIAAAPRHCRARQRAALVQARNAATAATAAIAATAAVGAAIANAAPATADTLGGSAQPPKASHPGPGTARHPAAARPHAGSPGRSSVATTSRPAGAPVHHHPLRHGHVATAGAGLGAASGQLSHHAHHVHRAHHSQHGHHHAGQSTQAQGETREELLILPGQLWFGTGGARAPMLRTLLGSCVAVTLWHPGRQIGGMCHYLLPARQRSADEPRDGRYGDEALAMLVDAIRRHGADPREFTAHLYGGADTLPEESTVRLNIGERNIEQGWTLIDQHGFQLDGVDVGDNVPRSVSLDLATGVVQVRRGRSA